MIKNMSLIKIWEISGISENCMNFFKNSLISNVYDEKYHDDEN